MAGIPAYKKVYLELKKSIRNGKYTPGTLLPPEPELEQMFSVSRTTVRKAISMLAADGYLNVQQGRGTEVVDVTSTQKLNTITSITETLTQKGYTVTTQGMCIDRIPAPEDVAAALEIPVNTQVFRVQRVQCANLIPISIMTNYLLPQAVPDLDQYTNQFTSLYAFLEKKYNTIFTEAIEHIYAMAADFNESQILKIPFGSPLLCSKRISHNPQGPFEYAVIKLVAEKYEYSVYLKGRN